MSVIADATLYYFGVSESLAHMAWMRVIAGRLEMRELRRAHRENDEAVREAYGWPAGLGELEMVERLVGMYSDIRESF